MEERLGVGGLPYLLLMRAFSDWVNSYSLVDLRLDSAMFTWSNNQVLSLMSRLDRMQYQENRWIFNQMCATWLSLDPASLQNAKSPTSPLFQHHHLNLPPYKRLLLLHQGRQWLNPDPSHPSPEEGSRISSFVFISPASPKRRAYPLSSPSSFGWHFVCPCLSGISKGLDFVISETIGRSVIVSWVTPSAPGSNFIQ
ncbi:hypothetical protein MRB53_013580 [Persea americana]|uniref:Uncharacterized protein n=1 Tax=Persea americana TaxID=3435 RepID=A0ACC2K8E0_PERAE|nr:hypothetical protein MRB53_013580 [Persea americana]